jgi:capping protein beta
MEGCANEVWESYTSLYYGSEAVGSVYLQKYQPGVFQGVFGIRKDCSTGSWNSAHLVQVEKPTDAGKQSKCTYHVQSTVVIALNTGASSEAGNKVQISASVARNTTQTLKVSKVFMKSNHIENIGTIIEDVEIDIRSSFERVHIPRTQEMVDAIQRETEKPGTQNLAMNKMMMASDAFKKRRAKMQAEQG